MAKKREWTLMFYLASDNPLAPGVISQLKAIKAAGFHKDANVIVQFDPFTEDTPTHIFDVNVVQKALSDKHDDIGFNSESPWVYNLLEDRLWGKEKDRHGKDIRDRLKKKYPDNEYNPGDPSDLQTKSGGEPGPKESLGDFLNFCAKWYPADHYVLFILGHGLVVGTETFLFDEHAPEHFLELKDLREVLDNFNSRSGGTLELVSFHSCSVSSLEVAYELKDCANYMLASQGAAFVGSWPYRQILMRIFNNIEKNATAAEIESMFDRIFYYCVYNSTDFLLAGYPFQVCLCNLKKICETREAIKRLSETLSASLALTDDRPRLKFPEFADSILLAHWKSQSFHQETYTDIADFCRCLYVRTTDPAANADAEAIRNNIQKACIDVVGAVKNSIVRASFAGPEYQYAKGLSIYFPWSQPLEEVWTKYKNHEFNNSQAGFSWSNFLETYFVRTMRDSIAKERENFIKNLGEEEAEPLTDDAELHQDQVTWIYTQAPLQLNQSLPGSLKSDKGDPTGDECACPSIKNYPRDIRSRKKRREEGIPADPKDAPERVPASNMFFGGSHGGT